MSMDDMIAAGSDGFAGLTIRANAARVAIAREVTPPELVELDELVLGTLGLEIKAAVEPLFDPDELEELDDIVFADNRTAEELEPLFDPDELEELDDGELVVAEFNRACNAKFSALVFANSTAIRSSLKF